MHQDNCKRFLLASHEATLLRAVEGALLAMGGQTEVVLTAEVALGALTAEPAPALAVLDAELPGLEVGQLLAAARAREQGGQSAIVLLSDTVRPEWAARMAGGVLDGLLPRAAAQDWWRLRLDQALGTRRLRQELEGLREAALLHTQLDRLTGAYNRETILAMLMRETDRAQRTRGALCLVLFDIDDFGDWNSRLGTETCDELLCQVAGRATRLMRSYDLLGRSGKDEFLAALPGCSTVDAMMLAERLRMDVFAAPYRVAGEAVRLSACFGVATSRGRSPMVVLREAEQALNWAKAEGPESIYCYDGAQSPARAPMAPITPIAGEELLA